MTVSVVVCTRDRASLLADCLDAAARLAVPHGLSWEVLVVDNGSRDGTAEVVSSAAERLPARRVVEAEPGLARARNRAIAEARGDYLLWTDDDVLPDPGWLRGYLSAFERHPEGAVFGGPVRPRLEAGTPAWLARTIHLVGGAFAARDLGPTERLLTPAWPDLPFGANYAVRAVEQRKHPYDEALGRTPGGGLGNEETLVLEAILSAGAEGWWVPEAGVVHRIPPSRQSTAYLRRYFEGEGRFDAWRAAAAQGSPGAPGRAGFLLRAAGAEAAYRLARAFRPPEAWVPSLIRAAEAWGRWRGAGPERAG
ncbi:MAG: glycosyltransferase [Gemmatimonadota bacterium]|jgi:hypothetical protein